MTNRKKTELVEFYLEPSKRKLEPPRSESGKEKLESVDKILYVFFNGIFFPIQNGFFEIKPFFIGYYGFLSEIFKKFTPIITIHHEDELKSKDHDGEKLYSMIEIPPISFAEAV